jgi:putative FmdB family regulatory protein
MPLYEYECEICGHRFEKIRKFSDPPVEICPKCGGAVRKLIASPAFHLKGSGWYATDYAKKDSAREGAGDGESTNAAGGPAETKDGKDAQDGKSAQDGKTAQDGKNAKDGKSAKDRKNEKDGRKDPKGKDASTKDTPAKSDAGPSATSGAGSASGPPAKPGK